MSEPDKIYRTEEEQKRAVEVHDKSREDLLKRLLSNNESYDKAILSLSSASLALSLTAIKFIIPLNSAINLWALKTSWLLFLITIICTLSSYIIGNKAISKELTRQEDYYINRLKKAQTGSNIYTNINSFLNAITGAFFVCGISLVIFFVIVNLNGDSYMTNQKTTKSVFLNDSASVPKMQLTGGMDNSTASADIPSMQLTPGTTPANKSATPSGDSSSTTEKSESK
jgi:multisubunit Na+/H+ antiporter MnhG subunit